MLRTLAAAMLLLLAACANLRIPDNTVCTQTALVPNYVSYCTSWGNGYCQAYATRQNSLASVCTAYACRPGFSAANGNAKDGCYAGSELAEKHRRIASVLAEQSALVAPQGESASWRGVFSPDGNRVAFVTASINLAGKTDGRTNIVVKDLRTGGLSRVTIGMNGEPPDGDSEWPQFTVDGNGLIFQSDATNLVAGDTNGQADIFTRDLRSGAVRRVSQLTDGRQPSGPSKEPHLSPDGKYLYFISSAPEWGGRSGECTYIRDMRTGSVIPFASATGCFYWPAFMSGSRAAVFSYERPRNFQTFNLRSGGLTTIKLNRILLDLSTVKRNPVSNAFTDSWWVTPTASWDGSKLAYVQTDPNGWAGEIHVFDLRSDKKLFQTFDSGRAHPSFSPDGARLAFSSPDDLRVGGDSNKVRDIVVRDLERGVSTVVSKVADGAQSNGHSSWPVFSPDGNSVMFLSDASNLVPGDTNGAGDIFIKNLRTGAVTRVSVAIDKAVAR